MADRRNFLLLGASLVVGIALFEVGVRASGTNYNLTPNWRYQPVLGWSQVPNGSYDIVVAGRPVHVSFNSMGFRDIEHQRPKPRGVKRIVIIGDSFCEAVQVNLEETFWKVLEKLLNTQGTMTWEVINLGVGDFGTAQEYIALRDYGLSFDPDVVVQEFFPLNDPCNNGIGEYDLCRSRNDLYRPYFVESDTGLRQTSGDPIRTYLRRRFVTYHVLEYWVMRLLGPNPQDPEDPGRPALLRAHGFNGLDPLLYTYVDIAQEPEAVAQGWRVSEKLLERIVALTREHGIAYVGVVFPFEMSVRATTWEKFARAQPPPPMIRDYAEQRLSALFTRLGVGSVMLLDEFQPYLDEVLPYVGGHLSVAGHRRTAEAIYRKLVQLGIAGR